MLLLMKFVYARFMQGKSFQSEKLRILLLCFTAVWIGNEAKSPACGEGLGWSLPVIQFPFDFIDGILSASVVPLCVPFFFAS